MWAAFILGLLGSLHCVGMCGPLAIVIHQQALQQNRQPWVGVVLYHIGRVSTYILLGILIGLINRNYLLLQTVDIQIDHIILFGR